jgi:hypothetical protein
MGSGCLGGRLSRRGWQQNRSFSAEGHGDGWNIACRLGWALKSEDLHYPALKKDTQRNIFFAQQNISRLIKLVCAILRAHGH